MEKWCRGCKHFDLDGTGDCCDGVGLTEVNEKPPCKNYEPNEDGSPNW